MSAIRSIHDQVNGAGSNEQFSNETATELALQLSQAESAFEIVEQNWMEALALQLAAEHALFELAMQDPTLTASLAEQAVSSDQRQELPAVIDQLTERFATSQAARDALAATLEELSEQLAAHAEVLPESTAVTTQLSAVSAELESLQQMMQTSRDNTAWMTAGWHNKLSIPSLSSGQALKPLRWSWIACSEPLSTASWHSLPLQTLLC